MEQKHEGNADQLNNIVTSFNRYRICPKKHTVHVQVSAVPIVAVIHDHLEIERFVLFCLLLPQIG